MKIFFWTMLAVVAGIFVYSKVAGKKSPVKRVVTALGGLFEGPDIDNKTGAYVAADARPGTVEFPAQGN
jgi:hypothetical protein